MRKSRFLRLFLFSCSGIWIGFSWFDKFAGSEFERTKCGPQGGGQEARSNPVGIVPSLGDCRAVARNDDLSCRCCNSLSPPINHPPLIINH